MHDIKCPTCNNNLEHVRYPSSSMLNKDQWEDQLAGNLFCRVCKSDKSTTGYKYYWDTEFK